MTFFNMSKQPGQAGGQGGADKELRRLPRRQIPRLACLLLIPPPNYYCRVLPTYIHNRITCSKATSRWLVPAEEGSTLLASEPQ